MSCCNSLSESFGFSRFSPPSLQYKDELSKTTPLLKDAKESSIPNTPQYNVCGRQCGPTTGLGRYKGAYSNKHLIRYERLPKMLMMTIETISCVYRQFWGKVTGQLSE